jgi:ribonuclease P protein component
LKLGRLRERRAFERLTRDGVRTGSETLWCRYLPAPDVVPPRAAFAIGRSIGSAVARNRLRRRLRAALESLVGSPPLVDGLLLVGARPAALERTFAELREELSLMLNSAAEPRELVR